MSNHIAIGVTVAMFDGVYTRWRILNSDFSIERAGYGAYCMAQYTIVPLNVTKSVFSQGLSLQSMHLLALILLHVSTIIILTQIALLSYVS